MEQLFGALQRLARSPAFKFFLIAFLIVLLLLVFGLVSEREGRARSVQSDVARIWGGAQQVFGPFLVVPYSVRLETAQGDKRVEQVQERRAIFLPEQLDAKAEVSSQVLHRSIYEVVVYTAKMTLVRRFLAPDINDAAADTVNVRWSDATFALGLSGVSGLKEAATLTVNGRQQLPFAPSLGIPTTTQNGIHVKLAGAGDQVVAGPDVPTKPFEFA